MKIDWSPTRHEHFFVAYQRANDIIINRPNLISYWSTRIYRYLFAYTRQGIRDNKMSKKNHYVIVFSLFVNWSAFSAQVKCPGITITACVTVLFKWEQWGNFGYAGVFTLKEDFIGDKLSTTPWLPWIIDNCNSWGVGVGDAGWVREFEYGINDFRLGGTLSGMFPSESVAGIYLQPQCLLVSYILTSGHFSAFPKVNELSLFCFRHGLYIHHCKFLLSRGPSW